MIYSTKIIDFIKNDLNYDISLFNETPFYQNDPETKKGNLLFDLTDEELKNIALAKGDVLDFAKNFCYANTLHKPGGHQIVLRDYQENYLREISKYRYFVCMASRQVGKTLLEAIYSLYSILHGKTIVIFTNRRDSGIEVLDKLKTLYKNLPFYMKPGVLSWNQTSIKFDNGARIISKGSSKGPALGFTIDISIIDEAAHIPHNTFMDIYNAVLGTAGQVIINSTPNGYNKFYEIYTQALDKNNLFHSFRIDWWQVPGRDEEWKNKEIQNLGSQEFFDREYGLSFGPKPEDIEKISSDEIEQKVKDAMKNFNLERYDEEASERMKREIEANIIKELESRKNKNDQDKCDPGELTINGLEQRLTKIEHILSMKDGDQPYFSREFVLTKFMGLTPDDINKLGLNPL